MPLATETSATGDPDISKTTEFWPDMALTRLTGLPGGHGTAIRAPGWGRPEQNQAQSYTPRADGSELGTEQTCNRTEPDMENTANTTRKNPQTPSTSCPGLAGSAILSLVREAPDREAMRCPQGSRTNLLSTGHPAHSPPQRRQLF